MVRYQCRGVSHTRPPLRPRHSPDTHHPSKLHYPKIYHNSSQQQRANAFIFQGGYKYTLTTSSVLTFFWPPFSKQFRLLFPPDFVSASLSPRVGGRLMKGCSQRNMGETYHGVSQPSRCEASYKKFRAAAAVRHRRASLCH